MKSFRLRSNLVDIGQRRIFPAEVSVHGGRIEYIRELQKDEPVESYIMPGFIDSHVHIESSMLVPSEFARIAVTHGTIATVSDPHEIANVCGLEGVNYMIEEGNSVPFYFSFGAPSCVPATAFETAGAQLNSTDVEALLSRPEIRYLSEMMNFPGVLNADPEVMQKLAAARKVNKPVDGHAPGLRGEALRSYIAAGIHTDHECFTREEAAEKLSLGMKILIREGSAARNFDALIGLLDEHPADMMFCSDDKHPDSLVEGHINRLCARAVAKGLDLFNVLKAACINPRIHYNLECGALRAGDWADFILVKDLTGFEVLRTFIRGRQVSEGSRSLLEPAASTRAIPNRFGCSFITAGQLRLPGKSGEYPVIEALDGQLITNRLSVLLREKAGFIQNDLANDILKIVVVNRYGDAPPAIAFVRNFGLQKGAIASSVAHDSHNIVAVGCSDEELAEVINAVIETKGGISCTADSGITVLPLPVAGLMSTENGYRVAEQYTAIDKQAKALGSGLSAPFMTLSFMALLVIPHLKLSDRGLFDGDQFRFVDLIN